jgi:hypothetical protein
VRSQSVEHLCIRAIRGRTSALLRKRNFFLTDGSFAHTQLQLSSLNPDYKPISLESAEEGTLRVVGEFVGVLDRGTA